MASLRDLQTAFADAVFSENAGRISTMIVADGLAPAARIEVYRNNARIGFEKALAAGFPIVAQLGGESWFKQTAWQYQRKYPSRSGNLHYIGERFADYLRDLLAGTDYAYFGDVAALEWAYQEILVAADAPSLDLSELSRVTPDEYAMLQFQLHPAVRIVESEFPIFSLWKVHKDPSQASAAIDLLADERVLIRRCDTHVELKALPRGEYSMLRAFERGATLEQSLEFALNVDPAFDARTALSRLARLGVFAGFSIATSH